MGRHSRFTVVVGKNSLIYTHLLKCLYCYVFSLDDHLLSSLLPLRSYLRFVCVCFNVIRHFLTSSFPFLLSCLKVIKPCIKLLFIIFHMLFKIFSRHDPQKLLLKEGYCYWFWASFSPSWSEQPLYETYTRWLTLKIPLDNGWI